MENGFGETTGDAKKRDKQEADCETMTDITEEQNGQIMQGM